MVSQQNFEWRVIHKPHSSKDPYATVQTLDDGNLTMAALRAIFPEAKADAENFVLFSTGGTHGTSATIEEVEREVTAGATFDGLTFIVIQPRIVCMRYGRAYPETSDDFDFLKNLRASSAGVMSKIGFRNN